METLELTIVENCDYDMVPEDRFGVLEASGNYMGDFATRAEAQQYIDEEVYAFEDAQINEDAPVQPSGFYWAGIDTCSDFELAQYERENHA